MVGAWCCITAVTSMILSVCWTCGSFTVFCTSESRASVVRRTGPVASQHNGHIHQQSLNCLLDSSDGRHLALCHQKNVPRCRLHTWSIHHSVSRRNLNLKHLSSSLLELNCPELVCMNTVTSASLSESCSAGTSTFVSVLQLWNLRGLLNHRGSASASRQESR